MSQQVVESVIGRLACDEEYRGRFALNRAAFLDELAGRGLALTPVERRALLATDSRACEEFAAHLDPRIQKLDLRGIGERSSVSMRPAEVDDRPARPTLRDVVAFIDGRPDNAGVAELAGTIACDHQAHLTAVFIAPERPLNPHDALVIGDAVQQLVAEEEAWRTQTEAASRRQLEVVAGSFGIEAEWRVIPRFSNYDATVHARYGDVAIVARSEAGEEHWGDHELLDALILSSGRPIVVLPPRCHATRIRRVLVGWNAGREAARAVADSLPLLIKAEAVLVLAVDAEPGRGGHGQEPGADVACHLARHGAQVDVRRLSSNGDDVARLILAQADAFRADLVVMGAYGRSRLAEHVFGGVTRTMLRDAALPVLLSH